MYLVLGDDIKSTVISTALMVLHGGVTVGCEKCPVVTITTNKGENSLSSHLRTMHAPLIQGLELLPFNTVICSIYSHYLLPTATCTFPFTASSPPPSAALTCCHPQHSPMLPLTTSPKTINNHYLSSSITVICDQPLLHTSLTTTNARHSA